MHRRGQDSGPAYARPNMMMVIFRSSFSFGLIIIAPLLAGMAIVAPSARASAEDPCYGISIEIQTEIETSQKSGNKGAKALASEIRKRHRLATVPPVALINDRLSENPTIVFQRPTDYTCAIAISKEMLKLSALSIVPQAAAPTDRSNVGIISVWWPAYPATVIADTNRK